MAENETLQSRVQLFRDAAAFKKPEHVPNISNCFTWKILDSEFTQKQALYDWKVMEKVVVGYHERYHFDAYTDFGTRDALGFTDALGGGLHHFDEASNSVYAVDIPDIFHSDEYVEFAKDRNKIARLIFARKYPDMNSEKLCTAMQEMMNYSQYGTKINNIMNNKYGIPRSGEGSLVPFELLFWVKGIKGMSIDLRRKSAEIQEACAVMWENGGKAAFAAIFDADNSARIDDMHTAMLAHSVLSRKQFEKIYWPYMNDILQMAAEKGKVACFYSEADIERFADFFTDVPRGAFVLWPEKDDLFSLREKLPDVALCGGIDSETLGRGTEQECIDLAKKLIDGLGEGYILGHRLMLSYPTDCKRENQLALNEFVRNYEG